MQRGSTKEYRYGSWWSVWWTGTYSMVLSKASFFHRQYLDLYTNRMLPSIRKYVNENRCTSYLTASSFLIKKLLSATLWCCLWLDYVLLNGSNLFGTLTLGRNCEDIAMSFLIANHTGAPPIWVQGEWAPFWISEVLAHHLSYFEKLIHTNLVQLVHLLHREISCFGYGFHSMAAWRHLIAPIVKISIDSLCSSFCLPLQLGTLSLV